MSKSSTPKPYLHHRQEFNALVSTQIEEALSLAWDEAVKLIGEGYPEKAPRGYYVKDKETIIKYMRLGILQDMLQVGL